MKIPTYEKQFTTPQPFNTQGAVPDYSDAIKTAALGQVVSSGMQAAGQIAQVRMRAMEDVKRKGLQMDAEEALKSVSDEVAEYINAKDYVTFEWEGNEVNKILTDDAQELLKYKLESNYRLLSEKIKSPVMRKEFDIYWKRMSMEVEDVLGQVNQKRRLESVSFITGKAMAKAESEGDLEEIYSIINMQLEAGLLRQEEAGGALEASKLRMTVNQVKDELMQLPYDQGLIALAQMRQAGKLPEEALKEVERWHKETWGLAKAAEKEVLEALKIEVNSEYVDRFYRGGLTSEEVLSDSRLNQLPGVKERWLNKIEARAEAGTRGEADPNKQTDTRVYAQALEIASDPSISPAQKQERILELSGADAEGKPQLNDTDTKSLLRQVNNGDIAKTTGVNLIKDIFSRQISAARRNSQKEKLVGEKNQALLEFEQIMNTGKYNAEQAKQIAQNIIEPFAAKEFSESMVSIGGFGDSWGLNPAEALQEAVQEDRLLGRTHEYIPQLNALYDGQIREFTAQTGLEIINTGFQENGQMLIEASDGNAYRMIVVNRDEAIQRYDRAAKKWEFINK